MGRILITGNSGAGKSTLSRALANKLEIPLIHLDTYYWQPNWGVPKKTDWVSKVSELVKGDSWIMDGNFASSLNLRLARATHLIHLDFPGLKCLYRCVKRRIKTGKSKRSDLAIGCNEQFDFNFYKFVLEYPKKHSPIVYAKVKDKFNGEFLVAKNDKDVTEILRNFIL